MLSETLKQAVIQLLEADFSSLEFETNPNAGNFVTIQPTWSEFGCVEILEDNGQLVVKWGRFTHGHIDSYDESDEEHVREIVEHLHYQLSNVLANKVAFWGQSCGGQGGFYFLDHVSPIGDGAPAYLWSGTELKETR